MACERGTREAVIVAEVDEGGAKGGSVTGELLETIDGAPGEGRGAGGGCAGAEGTVGGETGGVGSKAGEGGRVE
jgi:hypothetical protein